MSEELRAAAERLVRHQMFNSTCEHIWNAHGQCQWCKSIRRDVDVSVVASAYLSEHPADDAEKLYWIVCVERTRTSDYLIFWGQNRCGYTEDRNRAGRYTEAEAAMICRPNGGDIVHIAFADTSQPMAVVDRDRSEFFKLLKAGDNGLCRALGVELKEGE